MEGAFCSGTGLSYRDCLDVVILVVVVFIVILIVIAMYGVGFTVGFEWVF